MATRFGSGKNAGTAVGAKRRLGGAMGWWGPKRRACLAHQTYMPAPDGNARSLSAHPNTYAHIRWQCRVSVRSPNTYAHIRWQCQVSVRSPNTYAHIRWQCRSSVGTQRRRGCVPRSPVCGASPPLPITQCTSSSTPCVTNGPALPSS